jgi:hypothetical protein
MDWVDLYIVNIIRETQKAFLLKLEGGEERWVPKSVVKNVGDFEPGCDHCDICIATWFAEKYGFDGGNPTMADGYYVYVDVDQVLMDRERSFLVRLADGEEKFIPKSVIRDPDQFELGDVNCTFDVARWFCEKEEIAYE